MEQLTELKIKALKPKEKEYSLREKNGFVLRVRPDGSKTFNHIYEHQQKRYRVVLGSYPAISLSEARKRHSANIMLLQDGINPKSKTAPVAEPETLTVKKLIAVYLEQYCANNKTERTTKENKRILEKYIQPIIGSRPALDIRRRDAVKLIDDLAIRTPGAARGVMKNARAMFTWAMDRELVDINPFAGVSRSVQSVRPIHRERTLSDTEIQTMWTAFTDPRNNPKSEVTRRALMLILTTGVRPGEATGMLHSEVQGDWWIIPPEKSKNGKEHAVFLSSLAKEIIGEPFKKESTDSVFPGPKMVSIGVVSLSHYVRKNEVVNGWTPHDLRRTCATGLSRLGCPDEIIDAILNHTKTGVIRVYNRNKYLDEKRKWLQKWNDYLLDLTQ